MTEDCRITPPPPHLLKKFSAQAQDGAKKRSGAGYLKTFATLCIEWAMNSQSTPNDRQIRGSEIDPPPELLEEWINRYWDMPDNSISSLATQAARWGADQELEACCEWLELHYPHVYTTRLKRCRRPEPPSLKEQALQELDLLTADATTHGLGFDASAIRRAIESLPD